jgi:hypothetical protein
MKLVELAKGCVSMHLYGDWRGSSSLTCIPGPLTSLEMHLEEQMVHRLTKRCGSPLITVSMDRIHRKGNVWSQEERYIPREICDSLPLIPRLNFDGVE